MNSKIRSIVLKTAIMTGLLAIPVLSGAETLSNPSDFGASMNSGFNTSPNLYEGAALPEINGWIMQNGIQTSIPKGTLGQ